MIIIIGGAESLLRELFHICQQQRENSLFLRSVQSAKRAFLAERTTNKSPFFYGAPQLVCAAAKFHYTILSALLSIGKLNKNNKNQIPIFVQYYLLHSCRSYGIIITEREVRNARSTRLEKSLSKILTKIFKKGLTKIISSSIIKTSRERKWYPIPTDLESSSHGIASLQT